MNPAQLPATFNLKGLSSTVIQKVPVLSCVFVGEYKAKFAYELFAGAEVHQPSRNPRRAKRWSIPLRPVFCTAVITPKFALVTSASGFIWCVRAGRPGCAQDLFRRQRLYVARRSGWHEEQLSAHALRVVAGVDPLQELPVLARG